MADEENQVGQDAAGQDGIDWKVLARKWESRAKANAEKAKAFDEAENARKSELQKAREEADAYKSELVCLRAAAEADAIRSKVSSVTGVPASLIHGDDEETMLENAKAIAAFAKPKPAPKPPRNGKFASGDSGLDDAKRELARQIFGNN